MNSKRKGARSEWKIRDIYEKGGWYVVKAGGSLGLFDLVCLHPDYGTHLVQVKTNRSPSPAERTRLVGFQCHSSWTKKLAIVNDRAETEWFDL